MKAVIDLKEQQTIKAKYALKLKADKKGAQSDNTRLATKYDWSLFLLWLGNNKINLSAVIGDAMQLELVVSNYLDDCALSKSLSTVSRYRASLKRHFEIEYTLIANDNPVKGSLVSATMARISRDLKGEQKQAPAFEGKYIHQYIKYFDGLENIKLKNVQDRAILLTAYSTLGRVSELATIKVSDLNIVDGFVKLQVHKSNKVDVRHLEPLTVDAIKHWIEVSGISDGYLFRSIANSGAIGESLTTRSFIRCLSRCGNAIGLNGVSGHSCRVGGAIDMTKANVSIGRIMLAGGWTTPTMIQRYTRHLKVKHSGMVGIL